MLVSVPISSSSPSRRSLSSRISSMRSSSRSGETSSPNPCVAEWSVIARYCRPSLIAAPRHLLGGLLAVRQGRVAVQVALEVLEHDQLRQLAAGERGLELAAALAQLGRDPLQPELGVDLLLGRAAGGLARRVVEDPVLGDVQALAHRRLAHGDVVRLGAREVLQHVAELVGLDDLDVHLHARVRGDARAGVALLVDGLDQLELAQRRRQRGRLGGGDDDVDVLDRVGHPAQRARDLDPVHAGMRPQRAGDLVGHG